MGKKTFECLIHDDSRMLRKRIKHAKTKKTDTSEIRKPSTEATIVQDDDGDGDADATALYIVTPGTSKSEANIDILKCFGHEVSVIMSNQE